MVKAYIMCMSSNAPICDTHYGVLLAMCTPNNTCTTLATFESLLQLHETSIKMKYVGCRDDTVPKTVVTRRHHRYRVESLQQSAATSSLHLFLELWKIVACSQPYTCGAFL